MSIQRIFVHLLGAALFAMPLLADDVPFLSTLEAGGFVGGSYGIDRTRAMGGGNIVYVPTKGTVGIMPFVEVSYFPGIGRTQKVVGVSGATETFSVPLMDFNGGLHLRVRIPHSNIIPYGVIGVGGIHSPQRSVTATFPNPRTPARSLPRQLFRSTPLPASP